MNNKPPELEVVQQETTNIEVYRRGQRNTERG